MHELKTGKLIAASVVVAALMLDSGEAATIGLRRFAGELGILFQIVDDILDVTGTREEMGKSRGTDERLGKQTYVSVFGLERARELARESHEATRRALHEVEGELVGETDSLAEITDFIYGRES
jgi:geranylgeranyl diphosphate synthase type II